MLAALEISFDPAFAFPGERFAVITSQPATVTSHMLPFRASRDRWIGVAPPGPIEIFATVGPPDAYTDAAMKVLPVAKGSAIAKIGDLQIVPMHGEIYGAVLGRKRFPSIVSFSLAPRSAPERERPFRIDYVYVGNNTATLSGDAGGLVRASAHVTGGGVVLTCVALFDVAGSVEIFGGRINFALSAGDKTRFEVTIPDSEL